MAKSTRYAEFAPFILWSPSIRPIDHESLVLGPHAPRRIFDVTLDLQLIEPLFRRELSIERYALAFDCRKVSRGQEFHERELQLPPFPIAQPSLTVNLVPCLPFVEGLAR